MKPAAIGQTSGRGDCRRGRVTELTALNGREKVMPHKGAFSDNLLKRIYHSLPDISRL